MGFAPLVLVGRTVHRPLVVYLAEAFLTLAEKHYDHQLFLLAVLLFAINSGLLLCVNLPSC